MLTTHRECGRDSARNAIPSLGEIEGRMAILEVVAQAALTHALIEGDERVDAALLTRIRHAIHDKCGDLKTGSHRRRCSLRFRRRADRCCYRGGASQSPVISQRVKWILIAMVALAIVFGVFLLINPAVPSAVVVPSQ